MIPLYLSYFSYYKIITHPVEHYLSILAIAVRFNIPIKYIFASKGILLAQVKNSLSSLFRLGGV